MKRAKPSSSKAATVSSSHDRRCMDKDLIVFSTKFLCG
jgi:hypothetical protein